jgi:hypothetical protein
MASAGLSVSVEGVADVQKMLERYSAREMQNRERRAVRASAKPFQAALKAVAASSNVPHSFTKVPAAKVSAHVGADVEARVRPKSPLFNIFEPGAGGHDIAGGAFSGQGGGLLAGPAGGSTWTSEGRKRQGAFFARGHVRHPGMKARPIRPAAFARGRAQAMQEIARVMFEERA